MGYINLSSFPDFLMEKHGIIFWTSKKCGVSIRFRAYKLRYESLEYSLLR